jgi:hypothetical protein
MHVFGLFQVAVWDGADTGVTGTRSRRGVATGCSHTESEKQSDPKCQETLPGTMRTRTAATFVPLGSTACQEKLITQDK